jgi:Phosphotransferase enzyme family
MQSDNHQQPDPNMLRAAGIDSAAVGTVEPMLGGLSGAHLWRITTSKLSSSGAAASTSYVLKRVTPASGWLGAASRDSLMREVRLWEAGLLGNLPNEIATGVLRVARGKDHMGAAWGTLLMRDERAHLMRQPLRPPHGFLPYELRQLLDNLAKLHARFWQDPRLHDAALGLTPPQAALLLASPATIAGRIAQGDSAPYLTLARSGWEDFFRLAPGTEGKRLRAVFAAPERYIAAIQLLPATLVHGDVWGPNLGWIPATHRAPRRGRRLLLLDWALATAGPATYDPLWICGTWHALDPVRVLAYYRARLGIHLAAHRHLLDLATWLALADAGYLRTALTCGEALARTATLAPPGAARRRAEAHVRWWAARAARAAERLVPGG